MSDGAPSATAASPPAAETDGPHAWQRLLVWDAYTLLVLAAASAAAFLMPTASDHPYAAAALLTAILPLYLTLGHRAVRSCADDAPYAYGYLAAALALFATASFLAGTSWYAAFALVPHCFQMLSLRRACTAAVVVNMVPLAALVRYRHESSVLVLMAAIGVLGTLAAVFFGSWINRIITESRERARLIERLRSSRAEVARLSHAAGAAAERERLTAEIHDTLAQGFLTILTLLQAAERRLAPDDPVRAAVEPAIRIARDNLAEARALIAARPPVALDSAPVAEALRRLTAAFGEETGVDATYRVDGEPRPLSPAADVVLLRAAQEALANVRRHASARTVCVRLRFDEETARLTVADDGVGFDPDDAVQPDLGTGEHVGLLGLRRRAAALGGTVSIRSAPGAGTTVSVELPSNADPVDGAGPSEPSDARPEASVG
ncbi:two-component sensor histidine kinase [Actinomadura rubrobrunea]|uniref:Oxygen sensor histidine kinase NreB n=1 Tax=Actinomadura rubrobrunea TaxID=115335 RepID=A0A9W6PUT3_9ACTN|nr:sensor histidine kinase [Actinomadura rubrobrunea]GLW63611.1 two-component sensor histidine kinase [Actinomadura rubrobrunea]